jgi:hypothetical protein
MRWRIDAVTLTTLTCIDASVEEDEVGHAAIRTQSERRRWGADTRSVPAGSKGRIKQQSQAVPLEQCRRPAHVSQPRRIGGSDRARHHAAPPQPVVCRQLLRWALSRRACVACRSRGRLRGASSASDGPSSGASQGRARGSGVVHLGDVMAELHRAAGTLQRHHAVRREPGGRVAATDTFASLASSVRG